MPRRSSRRGRPTASGSAIAGACASGLHRRPRARRRRRAVRDRATYERAARPRRGHRRRARRGRARARGRRAHRGDAGPRHPSRDSLDRSAPRRIDRRGGLTCRRASTRAARIIDAIAADPRTVAELAEAFGAAPVDDVPRAAGARGGRLGAPTRHRPLHPRHPARRALEGGARLARPARGRRRARARLQRRTGNTVHLAALMDRSIVYVDKAEDESGVRMYSRIGKAVIPYCSAVGKAILANLDAAGRDAVLDGVTWERLHRAHDHHARAPRPRARRRRAPAAGRPTTASSSRS